MNPTLETRPKSQAIEVLLAHLEPVIQISSPNFWLNYSVYLVTTVRQEGSNITSYRLKACNRFRKLHFTPGQHVCLAVEINGRRLERTFSISSSHQALQKHGYIELSVKTQNDGKVTPWLSENIKPGHKVHLRNVSGEFTYHTSDEEQLFLAAGSGLTPILSMLESRQTTELKKLTLLYYVQSKTTAPFIDRLEKLAGEGLSLKIIETQISGRLTREQLKQHANLTKARAAYVCGPAGFIATSQTILKDTIKPERIHFEFFGLSTPKTNDELGYAVEVSNSSGKQSRLTSTGGTLLDELEESGLKPLYGCRAGICHQCTATKLSGRVQNILTNEVSENGTEQIQLCLCKAVSDTSLLITEREA
jgi:stearoyl-CoA 9-desaturase NADPH oxidoreductase